MHDRIWVKFWLGTCFLIILGIFVFNYKVDALVLYNDHIYDEISKYLDDNKIVAGIKNTQDRKLKHAFIKAKTQKRDTVVLGSSRVMYTDSNLLGVPTYNYWVTSSELRDCFAFLYLHKQKFKSYPKYILFGIDPWMFNGDLKQERHASIQKYSINFFKNLGINEDEIKTIDNIKKLLSFEYLKINLKSFGKKTYYLVDDENVDDWLMFGDGNILLDYAFRFADEDSVNERIERYLASDINKWYDYERFDTFAFEKFMEFTKDNGINVVLMLAPFHQKFYDIAKEGKRLKRVIETSNFIKKYAKDNDILLIGSYDPSEVGFSKEDFYDAIHTKHTSYGRLLNRDIFQIK